MVLRALVIGLLAASTVCLPLIEAGTVPNRYIVELTAESVSEHLARLTGRTQGRLTVQSPEARRQRTFIRAEQDTVRARIQEAEGSVMGALDTVANALLVQIPDAKAGLLGSIPGVRRVYAAREFELLLDHALPLHRVPQAWSEIGGDRAGAGAKIAIIDTGVDNSHPGFQDNSLAVPNGFPLVANEADLAFTNNKVIVARSYADLFRNSEPDPSPRDHVGHGTATAMAAAGVLNSGPLATISGVAPKAYIGSYKVFGSPGVNDGAPEDAILKAIDDAVADGMDVISMSLGDAVARRLSEDPLAQAVEHAASLGIIVAVAAGNTGPDPATIASPATAPSVIAVGATNNDRTFAASVLVPGSNPMVAVPGAGPNSLGRITAPLRDVSTLDANGLACATLPANSLAGDVALIFRGSCLFETKLINAAAAGAVGAIVYTQADQPDPIVMAVGYATLPAEMIGYQDGITLYQKLGHLTVTLQFSLGPVYTNPARLAEFSAKGPNVDLSIKPDMVAVGMNMYTAAEKTDPRGALYNPDGYASESGTSFSAPLIAGAAALLKSARPGMTAGQYRSLLVNSASFDSLPSGTGMQESGAGVLDMFAALHATAAVAPVSLSFGGGPADVTASQILTLSNIGTAADTFLLSVSQSGAGPAPQLPYNSIQLDAGAVERIAVTFSGTALAPGQYQGFIAIQSSNSAVVTRVPYWYAVASGTPHYLTVLTHTNSAPAGSTGLAVVFRVSDESGLPANVPPMVTVVSGGGRVVGVTSIDSLVPNAFGLSARLGVLPGANVFRIQAGDLTKDVTITGD
jgi:subtilisin family serine protease